MADYFVLYTTEDGAQVVKCTKKELESQLQDEDGVFQYLQRTAKADGCESNFRTTTNIAENMYSWEYDIAIIKGTLIIPQVKQQVTVWEV